jgi:hypothetical protein
MTLLQELILQELIAQSNKEHLEQYIERERIFCDTLKCGNTFMLYGHDMVAVPATPEHVAAAKAWSQKTFHKD